MRLPEEQIASLRRWNTPTIYNGWEAMTQETDRTCVVNAEETIDFMPEAGAMVGYAATVVIEPSNPEHHKRSRELWSEYRAYIGSLDGPTVVMVQDLDKPQVWGSLWGEVAAGIHRALGCVGAIVDGGVRDLEDMRAAGFKTLARRLCVGHAWATPVRWGTEVEVFGTTVRPGQLIHADHHGFIAIPEDDMPGILEAAEYMDRNECRTVISAGRNVAGLNRVEILNQMDRAAEAFGRSTIEKYGRNGEH